VTPLLLLAALGCDGDATTDSATPAAPTLTEVQAEVFGPSCAFSTCHAAPGASGLVLEDGQSHAELVDVPSADAAGRTLVVPGDSEGSYLVAKLRGDPGITGFRMPTGDALDDARLQLVIDWIDAGALDD
jgi:hypothetical protein